MIGCTSGSDFDVPWRSPREAVLPGAYRKPPANLLHVGVAGTRGEVRIGHLRGFHDVHYGSGELPRVPLEIGDIFLLGDNSFDSRDSRDLVTEPFRLDDLIGAPVAILAPLSRMRWL